MQTAVLIINHVHFPFHLFEQALLWAKENQAALQAVFLTHEAIELPNRKPSAVLSDGRSQDLIFHHLRFMEEHTDAHKVSFDSNILVHPLLTEVIDQMKDAQKIFVEIQDRETLKELSFSWQDLMLHLGRGRQVVSNKAY